MALKEISTHSDTFVNAEFLYFRGNIYGSSLKLSKMSADVFPDFLIVDTRPVQVQPWPCSQPGQHTAFGLETESIKNKRPNLLVYFSTFKQTFIPFNVA